jgi:hypothetical protein
LAQILLLLLESIAYASPQRPAIEQNIGKNDKKGAI